MNLRTLTSLVAVSIAFAACSSDVPVPPACDAAEKDVLRVDLFFVDAGLPQIADGGDSVAVPVGIGSHVPCLRGGTQVSVTTSAGTVNGSAAGVPATIPLAAVGPDAQDGDLAGVVTLNIPFGQTARVEVDLSEIAQVTQIEVDAEGGVTWK